MPKANKTLFLVALFFVSVIALHFLVTLRARITSPSGVRVSLPLPIQIFIPKSQSKTPVPAPVPAPKIPPEYFGEKIVYDVRYGALSLGRSQFNSIARVELDGRQLNLLVFETKLNRFSDTEKIYSDPLTTLPVRVERTVLNWLSHEKITEEYDQQGFTVTITKAKGQKQQKTVIKKSGYINNPILLPYYVRNIPRLEVGTSLVANLPNRRFEIRMTAIENIKVPAGTFKAYRFESTPRQIEIWISADARRIPIKIQGTGLFGYLMLMKEYYPPNTGAAGDLFASGDTRP